MTSRNPKANCGRKCFDQLLVRLALGCCTPCIGFVKKPVTGSAACCCFCCYIGHQAIRKSMYAYTQAHSRSQLLVIFFRQPEMEHSSACEQRCINQPRRMRVVLWCTGWLCTRSFVVCKKMTGLFGPFSYAGVLHALFTLRRFSSGVK